jgi:hypothetical protein
MRTDRSVLSPKGTGYANAIAYSLNLHNILNWQPANEISVHEHLRQIEQINASILKSK